MAALEPFGKGACRTRDAMHHPLHVRREPLKLMQIRAEHLHTNRGTDAGRQHIDACLDRHSPGIAHARQAQSLIHLGLEFLNRHAGGPFALGLQIDHGFGHLDRRRIGCGIGATGLAEDGFHFGK